MSKVAPNVPATDTNRIRALVEAGIAISSKLESEPGHGATIVVELPTEL